MKAIRIHTHGGPEVLQYEETPDPVPADAPSDAAPMDMRAGGGGPPRPEPAPAVPARVGTTDWWKLAGLALVLADHYGLFFDPDTDGWRVVGRIAAPIFFFLIGFARTRRHARLRLRMPRARDI